MCAVPSSMRLCVPVLLACIALAMSTGCPDDEKPVDVSPDMTSQVDLVELADEGGVAPDDGIVVTPDAGPVVDMPADMPPVIEEDRAALLEQGCNPLGFEQHCFFPYPSNVFLSADASTPSGKLVVLPEVAQLTNKRGKVFDMLAQHPADGFSHHQPIIATFGQEIDDANLTFHTDDYTDTLKPTSTTLLIKADTGELVAHWAEIDRVAEDPASRMLFVRALKNLDHETRYVVAVQGLKGGDGALIDAPRGFKALRDGGDDELAGIPELRTRYNTEVFPVLTDLGVDLSDVQLAWDFTTQSEQMVTGDLVGMRDDLMAKLEASPPAVTITAIKDLQGDSDTVALRVEGTITVPLYLEQDELFPLLNRDASGKVVANGTHEVPFTLHVPTSAMPEGEDFEPARVMQYGHGFFGEREEINYSFMRGLANEQGYVTAAVNWRGMATAEVGELVGRLISGRIDSSLLFINGAHQGIINFIALSHALKTTIPEVPELTRFGKLLYAPEDLYYYGISQGQILGAAFLALSPHVERAAMEVGGAPFSFMMGRSNNFVAFFNVLGDKFDDLALQQYITLSQHSFDRIDPSTYSAHLLKDRFDGGPEGRTILMRLGYWDHSVPTLAGLIYARNMGIDVLTPSPVVPYGLSGVEGPVEGSAVTLIDFGVEDPPGFYAQLPTDEQIKEVEEGLNVHEAVRKLVTSKSQLDAFLRKDGVILHGCDGPCDPY
jgi:hypothetical protein